MLYHLASHLSTLGECESEESEFEESENEESKSEFESLAKRPNKAQELGVMHQVWFDALVLDQQFVEIMKWKTGIIRASNSIFSFPFLFFFRKKNDWPSLCSMSFSLNIFHTPIVAK